MEEGCFRASIDKTNRVESQFVDFKSLCLVFLQVLHQHGARLLVLEARKAIAVMNTYFCSWNLWPTLSLCFKNFSEHLEIHELSLVVKFAEVKSLTQSSKHLETKLEYNLMKSFICFCSTICWNSCCSLTFN